MKTILVTGGAGFIGSNLIQRLLNEEKTKIICIDNFNDYYNPKLKEENIKEFKKNKRFKLYRFDILEKNKLEKIFKENKINLIIHLAARAGVRPSIENPVLYYQVNVDGTLNLLELAKKFKVKNFIFASSSSVYGENKKIPFSEDDQINNPVSPYAITKIAGEMLCKLYHINCGLNFLILRFFTVYGPKQRPEMAISKFSRKILEGNGIEMYGKGNTKRDYTYIDDIVEGIIKGIKNNYKFEILNLGNNNPITLKNLIKIIEKKSGKKAKIKKLPLQTGDVKTTYADITKAKKCLIGIPKQILKTELKNTLSGLNPPQRI